MNKIKVLIVDDSIFMRKALESLLSGEPDIEIVGLAKNGKEGVEMAEQFHPDASYEIYKACIVSVTNSFI